MRDLVRKIRPCDMNSPYVFVSYSKQDAERVYPLILRLQELGCNIWIDRELTKMVGQSWQLGAMRAMSDTNCRGLLFMISENSLKSAPVFAELALSQKHRKVQRKHGGSGIKIIPVNADPVWSQSKIGLATWIGGTVSMDETPLTEDDRACLNIGGILRDYIAEDSMSRLEESGEIAQAILDEILAPLGGGKITVASIEDLETVRENIDEACFNRPVAPLPAVTGGMAWYGGALPSVPKMQPSSAKAELPKQTAQKGSAAEGSAPEGSAPKESAQDGSEPREFAQKGTEPEKSAPVGSAQEGTEPEKFAPEGSAQEGSAAEGSAPERSAPEKSAQDGSEPKGSAPGESAQPRVVYPNGDIYEGELYGGVRCGRGKMTYANGDVYVGTWKNDLRDGAGTTRYAGGDVYSGNYREDKRHGFGKYSFSNGNVYEGGYCENKRQGFGIFRYANGESYEGSFVDGKRCGHGKYTFTSGEVREGDWHDNKPV